MTCTLKSCPHGKTTRCASLEAIGGGECGAAYALELSRRNDGYLVLGYNNPTIEALRGAGLITTKDAGDGCLIARAVHIAPAVTRNVGHGSRWARAREIGPVLA